MLRFLARVTVVLMVGVASAHAGPATAPARVTEREWTVDGVTRTGIIVMPATSENEQEAPAKLPVLFVFHGHMGSARQVRRASNLDTLMPGAITVYLQGLPTKTRYDPEGKSAGWQSRPGDQADRDLKFVDAVWADLQREAPVDPKRVFAYGHSNGGIFVFTLWAERGDLFRAVATSGSLPAWLNPKLAPKPAMHIAGRNDRLARIGLQERSMEATRRRNGCEETPTPWNEYGERYASPTATPFVGITYDGGHAPPDWSYPLIAKFFAEFE